MSTPTFSGHARSRRSVIVLGGGILGASTAYHLARLGCTVTLVSRGPASGGASWRSFGWINAAQEVPAEYHYLRTLGALRHRAFAMDERFARSVSFPGALAWEHEGKTVQVVQGAEQPEAIGASFRRLRLLGHPVSLVDSAEATVLEPLIDPATLPDDGILHAQDEGWVDLPSLVAILTAQLIALGGQVVTDSSAGLRTIGDRVVGIALSDGSTLGADAVVVATGADVPATLAPIGLTVPTKSSKAALLITKPVTAQPRMLLRTPVGSVRPEPRGRLVVHTSSVEDQTRIVDGRVVLDDRDVVEASLTEIADLYRGIDSLEIEQLALGLRPIPGDGLPIVGGTGVAGCYVAYAHSGATVGPIVGELLAQEIADEGFHSPLLETFRLSRFA